MAYEAEEIRTSQEIFYYLLEHHELREEDELLLYKAYTEEETVRNLVKSQGDIAGSNIERYGNVIYLIPKEENNFLGFSKQQLKSTLCKSGATDKDYYLSQFVILTLLVEFFDGQGSSSKSREYMRVGELLNCLSARLKEGAAVEAENEEAEEREDNKGSDKNSDKVRESNKSNRNKDKGDRENKKQNVDTAGISFQILHQTYEALKSDDRGSRMKTTKEGFIYNILMFLQKQGLIEYVVQDEMIKTTRKLDNFMDWNLLNQNNYQRVLRVLGVTKDEQD